MKKIFAVMILFSVLCSCSAKEPEVGFCSPAPIENGDEHSFFEEETEEAKIILALPHHLDENYLYFSAGDPIGSRVDIPFAPPEDYDMDKEKVIDIEIPEELLAEIKADFPDFEGNEKWKATLTYYSHDLSAGMIKMIYVIGDRINTDKAIVCQIENGKIIRINYTNMEASADEENLLERVENFEKTTVQTKKIFEEGELLIEEETTYRYCFGADKLIYCYQLYFYEPTPMGSVINNDYFSEYIIE